MDGATEAARHVGTIHWANPKVPWLQPRHLTKPRGVCIWLFIVQHRVAKPRVSRAIVTSPRAVGGEGNDSLDAQVYKELRFMLQLILCL